MNQADLQKSLSNRRLLGNLLIVSLALFLFITILNADRKHSYQHQKTTLQQGFQFIHPTPLPPFSLIDANGHSFTNKNLTGHWSVLFFGSTQDRSFTATALTELTQFSLLLEKKKSKRLPEMILISMPSGQDSLQTLRTYLDYFNGRFVGLTGSAQNLNQWVDSLERIYHNAGTETLLSSEGKKPFPLLQGLLLIVNPQGQWIGGLAPPYDAELMAEDFSKFNDRAVLTPQAKRG